MSRPVVPVTIKDALVFISKRAENNLKRLNNVEALLEQVAGDEGGEKDLERLNNFANNAEEKINGLKNRVTNLEKDEKIASLEEKVINTNLEKDEKIASLEEKVEKINLLREEELKQLKTLKEELTALTTKFSDFEKNTTENNRVELVLGEN